VPVSSTQSLLAARAGRLFIAAQGLDSLAIGVSGVALPWLVLEHSGSAALAGLAYPATIVPYVVFGLPAGLLGDRRDWRRVMVACHALQALVAAVVPLWAIAGEPSPAVALATAFAVGSARVYADAAAFGAVASLVGPEAFTEGQSTLSATWAIGFFAGPAIGGTLVSLVGPAYALGLEAGAFAIATALIAAAAGGTSPAYRQAGGTPAGGLRDGLRFIASDRMLRRLTPVSLAFSFCTAGAFGLQVPLLRDVIGLSAPVIGALLAAGAVAAGGPAMAPLLW
jgi:MFS family permease